VSRHLVGGSTFAFEQLSRNALDFKRGGFVVVQVVYHWAKGALFREICEKHMPAGVMEGDIVQSVKRLEQACQDIMSAARVMGNTALFEQFEEASKLIKRDIIFAGSLYVFK
jgi:antiviral helicase SKI2